jgi:phosphoribosylanthranilate isomerase
MSDSAAPLVQIYGLTTEVDARAVDALGPDHVGLVLDEGLGAWDSVDLPTARSIRDAVAHARIVGLSLSNDPARIATTVRALDPDIVHVVRASELAVAELARLRTVLGKPLMLTVPVTGEEAVGVARRLAAVADFLLLDSREPQTGIVGATGLTHDWSISASIVAAAPIPVILAGGLGPHNVVEAMRQVQPAGLDSETHTSSEVDRRRKDLDKVRAFIDLARSGGIVSPSDPSNPSYPSYPS